MNQKSINTYSITLLIMLLLAFLAGCGGSSAAEIAGEDTAVPQPADTIPADTVPTEESAADAAVTAVESAIVEVDNETDAPSASVPMEITTNALTADEIAGLLFMREEEKLARDVYQTLYDLWGMNIFNNIAASEQMHIDAVINLLAAENIPDPAENNPVGQFTNQDLQELYDDLIATGSESLTAALTVGGAIEEIDILDLESRISATDNGDIIAVYENLIAGSENHLRSFVATYERQAGVVYQPQFMEQAMYDAILTNTSAHGNGQEHEGNVQGNDSQGNGNQGNGSQGNGNQGNGNQGNGNNGEGGGRGKGQTG